MSTQQIDHLVYGTPHLDATVQALTEQLGVAASPGGQHLGRGTRNYLLSLSGGSYLEIIGPDPDQPAPPTPRHFQLDELEAPLLVGWAARAPGIEQRVERSSAGGYDPGPVVPMSRTLPNGDTVSWRLTSGTQAPIPSLIPFLIDWGDTPHPSATSSQGAELLGFRIETPDPDQVRQTLRALGLDIEVSLGNRPQLIARIRGANGEITLQ